MERFKTNKKSETLMRAFGILAIVLCMLSLVLVADVSKAEKASQATIGKAEALTNSNTEDLPLEITQTRGGVVLEDGGAVYEGEYIKYSFKVANATEEVMENVRIVASIPEGVKYAKLNANFEEFAQPYFYEFDETKRENTIEIGTLEAGESKEVFYEVKVNDLAEGERTKTISTKIDSYIGEALAQTYQITNIVKQADTQLFMGAFTDLGSKRYGLNIKSDVQKQVEVKVHLPKEYHVMEMTVVDSPIDNYDCFRDVNPEAGETRTKVYSNPEYDMDNPINNVGLTLDADNVITVVVETNKQYTFMGIVDQRDVTRKDSNDMSSEIAAYAEVVEKGYMSNETRLEIALQNAEITMTSSKDGQEVRYGEEIDYEITITNTGKNSLEKSSALDFINLTVLDFLPENVTPISINYNNWEISSTADEYLKVEEVEPTTKNIEGNQYDLDGNKLADIEANLIIPRGESVTMQVATTAGMVYEKTPIVNTATLKGEEIPNRTSNEVSHTILPYNYDDEVIETPSTETPSIGETPEVPSIPSTPGTASTPTIKPSSAPGAVSGTPNSGNNSGSQNNGQTVDFKIDNYISKVSVKTVNGVKEKNYNNETLVKTEIRAKEMDGAIVTVEYKIVVTNEGTVAGTVGKIVDNLPEGLTFVAEANSGWSMGSKGELTNTSKANTIIEPGQSATFTLIATKQMTTDNTGTFRNRVSIESATSTTGVADSNLKNNSADSELVISVSTGAYVYISLAVIALAALVIIAIYLYKKGKLDIKAILKKASKTSKVAVLAIVFTTTIFAQISGVDAKVWTCPSPESAPRDWYDSASVHAWCTDGGIIMPATVNLGLASEGTTSSYRAGERVLSTVTLIKGQENVVAKVDGDNMKYGPFTYTSQNAQNFDVKIYNGVGIDISSKATISETLTDGSHAFYIQLPKSECANGISKVDLIAQGPELIEYNIVTVLQGRTWGGGSYQRLLEDPTTISVVPQQETRTRERIIEWDNLPACLDVIKVDKDNHSKTLAGVKLKITGPSINGEFVTDENGKLPTFENIQAGNYRIEEIEIPHYGYYPDVDMTITVVKGQMLVLEVENEKQTGNLRIHKQNNDSGSALTGFRFKLQNSKGEYIIAEDEAGPRTVVEGNIVLTNLMPTSNIDGATEFVTDELGNIGIYNILVDTYTVLEVSEGENQYFDAADKDFIGWSSNLGQGTGNEPMQIQITRQPSYETETINENVIQIIIVNKQKYVDISGLVWEDMLDGKTHEINYVYDPESVDQLVDHVSVRLVDATTGETVENRYGKLMQQRTGEQYEKLVDYKNGTHETVNNERGRYTFEKIEIDKLKDYYVEFTYNGMSYQSLPVEKFFGNPEAENVSKASEDGPLSELFGEQRRDFNNKFQTITYNNANGTQGDLPLEYKEENHTSTLIYGQNPVYGWDKAEYPINDVYDQYLIKANTYNLYNGGINMIKSEDTIRKNDIDVIENVNLGIYKREQPDLSLAKDLKSVRLSINGFNHIYEYAQRHKNAGLHEAGLGFNVGPKFENDSAYALTKYTRAIYRADYNWENKEKPGTNELEVHLVYEIIVRNSSSNVTATVNQIVDYYDKDYNSVVTVSGEYEETTGLVVNGKDYMLINPNQKGANNEYNEFVIDTSGILNNIEAGYEKSVYVQFELTREKIKQILDVATMDENGNITSQPGNEAELDNIAEITSYSITLDGEVYAGIDTDSNPGTLLQKDVRDITNIDRYEDDTDKAPALRLELAEQRELSGLVFEDKTERITDPTTGKTTREGNGKYVQGEDETIDGVKVSLYKASDIDNPNKQPVEVWSAAENKFVPAKDLETHNGGQFEISGYIPDEYVAEYTWGDDKHTVQSYKATIYKSEEHKDGYWYESIDPRYSDAYDNWQERQAIDKQLENIYWGTENEITIHTMHSTTPLFRAEVEYDYDNLKSTYEEELGRRTDGIIYRIINMDFGIAERPKQSVDLDKTISHINLTLLSGQVLVDADVEPYGDGWKVSGETSKLIPLPKDTNNNADYPEGRIWLQMDNELIQGATLEITYTLKATNTSELDYNNPDFYQAGTVSSNRSNIVKLTVENTNDYLDAAWGHQIKDQWVEKELEDITPNPSDTTQDRFTKVAPNVANSETIKNRIILSTNELAAKDLEPGDYTESKLNSIKVLTTARSDIELKNEAEIIYVRKNGGGLLERDGKILTTGDFIPGSGYELQPDDTMAPTFIITPNTGANLAFILPVMIGIASFAILAGGVTVIRKKVLGKD